jgi:inhibitor of growth protein 3
MSSARQPDPTVRANSQYHVACLNLDKAPEGNWICPQCLERRKRNPKAKKPSKAVKRR